MTETHSTTIETAPQAQQPQAPIGEADPTQGLAWAVSTIARIQSKTIDRLRLHQAVSEHRYRLSELSKAEADKTGRDDIYSG